MVQNSPKVTKKVLVFRKVARSCSLTKKLLKILKVAKKLPSRIWKGLHPSVYFTSFTKTIYSPMAAALATALEQKALKFFFLRFVKTKTIQ